MVSSRWRLRKVRSGKRDKEGRRRGERRKDKDLGPETCQGYLRSTQQVDFNRGL